MMKAQWQYDDTSVPHVTGVDNGGLRVVIAKIYGADQRELDAHGRLIAAAPELLTALKAMVGVVECELTVEAQGCCPELDAARAAIVQAESGR